MCTSVPQIDATFTRIRTSVGLIDGTGTVRSSVLFGAAFDFTAAFIVDAIPKSPDGPLMDPRYFNFLSFLGSGSESGMHALSLPLSVGWDVTSTCDSRRGRTGTRALGTPRRG